MQYPDETPFRLSGAATVWHLDKLYLIGHLLLLSLIKIPQLGLLFLLVFLLFVLYLRVLLPQGATP